MTSIVATTDWHLDARTAGAPRRDDLSQALDASVKRAMQLRTPGNQVIYLFAGDLCDPWKASSHAAVATAIDTATRLHNSAVESLWIVGNHDVIEDGTGDHALMALGRLNNSQVRVVAFPQIVSYRHVDILCLPYPSVTRAYDPVLQVQLMAKGRGKSDRALVIAGHLTLQGLLPGSEATEMPKGREIAWPLATLRACFPGAPILAGHHHHSQVFEGVHVIGSLGRLTFADAEHTPRWLEMEL